MALRQAIIFQLIIQKKKLDQVCLQTFQFLSENLKDKRQKINAKKVHLFDKKWTSLHSQWSLMKKQDSKIEEIFRTKLMMHYKHESDCNQSLKLYVPTQLHDQQLRSRPKDIQQTDRANWNQMNKNGMNEASIKQMKQATLLPMIHLAALCIQAIKRPIYSSSTSKGKTSNIVRMARRTPQNLAQLTISKQSFKSKHSEIHITCAQFCFINSLSVSFYVTDAIAKSIFQSLQRLRQGNY